MSRKLIIFDYDGTLISSLEGITACMQEALSGFGFARPEKEAVRRTIGLTLEESVERLTEYRCDRTMIASIVKAYRALHDTEAAPRTSVFDGAIDLLKYIKGRDIGAVLVSNKGSAGLHQLLQQLDMKYYFDLVLSAHDVIAHKPSPELYVHHIAPHFPAIDRSETLVVGDTEADIRFARHAEIDCCWAEYGYGNKQACEALLPKFRISSLPELVQLL